MESGRAQVGSGADVGLNARDMSDTDRLALLALNPQGIDRRELYLAVASLYRIQSRSLNDHERVLMHDILRRVARHVDVPVRRELAERLADDVSAPQDLVMLLAEDVIEVARPIILRSPMLADADMLRLIACSVDHRVAIAERNNIGEKIADALVQGHEKIVLVALVRNATARMSPQTIAALEERSVVMEELQEPLARRAQSQRAPAQPTTAPQISEPASRTPSVDNARKLIDKLSDSGQLKAGYLLRVLNQGQTELFDMALAKLVNLPVIELRSRFYRGGPRAVALACRGVGIDRCVFPTVFNLSRRAHNMHVDLSRSDLAEVDEIFSTVPKSSALSELASLTFN